MTEMTDWEKERAKEAKWKAENRARAEEQIMKDFEALGRDYEKTVNHFYKRSRAAWHPQALPCFETKRWESFLYEIVREVISEKK